VKPGGVSEREIAGLGASPLFVARSVVAREYGIPAVVGVPGATRAIRTGQRVRVHGDLGYVEVLSGGGG
jgi:phosphohistidine swiveling domain-containing protein